MTDANRQIQRGRNETTLIILLTTFIFGILAPSEQGEKHLPNAEDHMYPH